MKQTGMKSLVLSLALVLMLALVWSQAAAGDIVGEDSMAIIIIPVEESQGTSPSDMGTITNPNNQPGDIIVPNLVITPGENNTVQAGQDNENKDAIVTNVQPQSKPVYIVQFVDYLNNLYYAELAEEGGLLKEPELIPELEGHTFLYWYDTSEDAQRDAIDSPIPLEFPVFVWGDAILKAYFEADATGQGFPKEPEVVEIEAIPSVMPVEQVDALIQMLLDGPQENEIVGHNKIEVEALPDDATGNIEPIEIETIEDESVALAGCVVNVYSNHSAQVMEGDTLEVWGELFGFENMEITLQWQRSLEGENWEDVPGANGLRYSFVATEESVGYYWRLMVTVNGFQDI